MSIAIGSHARAEPQKSEAEYLVPPQGGACEVPVHAGAVCILSFPEKMAQKALAISPDYQMLRRKETVRIAAHERNDDHVIVHVRQGQLLGEDGYLLFEIENRSKSAYRLARVRVLAGDRDVAGPARLACGRLSDAPLEPCRFEVEHRGTLAGVSRSGSPP